MIEKKTRKRLSDTLAIERIERLLAEFTPCEAKAILDYVVQKRAQPQRALSPTPPGPSRMLGAYEYSAPGPDRIVMGNVARPSNE